MSAGVVRRNALRLSVLLLLTAPAYGQSPPSACEAAGRDAEQQYALPAGLLDAIGRVESGRFDPTLGRVIPTPWAIDAAGQPNLADSKIAALQRTRELQTGGLRNIDVGCFQINLQAHPSAFADLDQAFDPTANAQYAAHFLTSLHARLGSWDDAVAAYHSATPALGIPYRQLVYANWATPDGWRHALAAAPSVVAKLVEPLRIFSVGGAEVRVWTPSSIGHAAAVVAISGGPSMALPRVISPRG